ncbi:MAG TPA: hypothetical protein VHB21_11300 [Minicystis sp.]|nr:hypothetical protein [Minicystis sp.]
MRKIVLLLLLTAPAHQSSDCRGCEGARTPSGSHASSHGASSHGSGSGSWSRSSAGVKATHESGPGLSEVQAGEIAGEVLANGIVAVAEASSQKSRLGECRARCPGTCDPQSALCSVIPSGQKEPVYFDPVAEPNVDVRALPTCHGLCLPGERCVVAHGVQDCVAVGSPPPPRAPTSPTP